MWDGFCERGILRAFLVGFERRRGEGLGMGVGVGIGIGMGVGG